jgi:MaoC like domain
VESFGTLIGDKNPLHDTTLEWDAAVELMPFLQEHVQAGILETIHKENDQDMTTTTATRIPSTVNIGSADVTLPATTTKIRAVVHGMLVSSLFSSIFATLAPGCVYINQSLDFVSPVFVDDVVVGRLEITRVRQWPRRRRSGVVVTCDTQILRRVVPTEGGTISENNNNSHGSGKTKDTTILAVRGAANVWLPIGSQLPQEAEMSPSYSNVKVENWGTVDVF